MAEPIAPINIGHVSENYTGIIEINQEAANSNRKPTMLTKQGTAIYEKAKQFLRYDEMDGKFYWKKKVGSVRVGDVAGCLDVYGYVVIRVCGIILRAHRMAWFFIHGKIPSEIDHKDHNRQNNKIENLRAVDHESNSRNITKPKNNTTGVVGVYALNNKWMASIVVGGKTIYLGYSENFNDMVNLRKAAEVKFGFHENHGQERKHTRTKIREKEPRGVSFHKVHNKWQASITINRKTIYLGIFQTETEARTRRQLAEEFFRAFA